MNHVRTHIMFYMMRFLSTILPKESFLSTPPLKADWCKWLLFSKIDITYAAVEVYVIYIYAHVSVQLLFTTFLDQICVVQKFLFLVVYQKPVHYPSFSGCLKICGIQCLVSTLLVAVRRLYLHEKPHPVQRPVVGKSSLVRIAATQPLQ